MLSESLVAIIHNFSQEAIRKVVVVIPNITKVVMNPPREGFSLLNSSDVPLTWTLPQIRYPQYVEFAVRHHPHEPIIVPRQRVDESRL